MSSKKRNKMGKTFKKKKRRTKLSKTQRRKDRRRIRSRNRKSFDKIDACHYVKALHKNWPCLFQNHSSIPNTHCSISLDELSFMTLLELGNLHKQIYTYQGVKSMIYEKRIDACITVITKTLDTLDTMTNNATDTKPMYRDMLFVLKYFVSCKKQLLRRGSIEQFKGHSKNCYKNNEKPNHEPKYEPKATKINPLSKNGVKEKAQDEPFIPIPPPLPAKEQLMADKGKICIAQKIKTSTNNHDKRSLNESIESIDSNDINNSTSWSCQIM